MNNIREEEKTPQKKKFNWKRFWFWLIFLIVISLVIIIVIQNMIYARRKALLSSCSGNLRNLGIIITNYSTDHKGHYPQNLEVIETLGYIEKLPVCPVSGKSYLYYSDGWNSTDFIASCPNPQEHVGSQGPKSVTSSLYYASGRGVIAVANPPPSCGDNLRDLKRIIIIYSINHKGHYPQNLQVLKDLGNIEKPPACPETNKSYIYQINGWDDDDFTIWCPNPEKHSRYESGKKLKSLYYHKGEGIIKEKE
ncbi:hypothetical protein KAU33_13760 [Candidatus Dependentiae bacterium]|nr:hypothetical protein [Candidatus Dependentiae bacterium]